jgi:hypothetical protein
VSNRAESTRDRKKRVSGKSYYFDVGIRVRNLT